MAITHATRNHPSNLAHGLVIATIALGLVLSAFVVGALASYAGVNLVAQPTPESAPSIQPTSAPAAAPPAATPEPATPAPVLAGVPSTPAAAPVPQPHKVIVVSLSDQRLTAYEDGQVFLTTVVATGRPELPTPKGTFHIQSKASPYKFVSPWPKGDPYWYPTEWVSYAMLFADDGYFLHDAPWRTVWGPGANVTQGTHGCVNVPTGVMARLYAWAEVGTTVVIQ